MKSFPQLVAKSTPNSARGAVPYYVHIMKMVAQPRNEKRVPREFLTEPCFFLIETSFLILQNVASSYSTICLFIPSAEKRAKYSTLVKDTDNA